MTYIKLLYGSRARGESDGLSDIDLLLVSDAPDADYSWSEIGRLRDYGSLFLWHLCLEAKLLESDDAGSSRWEALCSEIPAYERVDQDLDAFEMVLGDVRQALSMGDTSLHFEGDVLARTIRHAAILACYLDGSPNFSRYGAVQQTLAKAPPQMAPDLLFEHLYDFVLQPKTVTVAPSDLVQWVDVGLDLVARMRSAQTEANV